MPREVVCPTSKLNGLHEHCNNKIAWFKSELISEHRDWLSTFITEARNTIQRSEQNDSGNVLRGLQLSMLTRFL